MSLGGFALPDWIGLFGVGLLAVIVGEHFAFSSTASPSFGIGASSVRARPQAPPCSPCSQVPAVRTCNPFICFSLSSLAPVLWMGKKRTLLL